MYASLAIVCAFALSAAVMSGQPLDGRITQTEAKFCEKGAEFMAKFYSDSDDDGATDAVTVVWCDHHIQSFDTKIIAGEWPKEAVKTSLEYDGQTWEGKREWMYVLEDSSTGRPVGVEKKERNDKDVKFAFYDAKEKAIVHDYPNTQPPVIEFKRADDGRGTTVHFEYYAPGHHNLMMNVERVDSLSIGAEYYEYDIVTEGKTGTVELQLYEVPYDSKAHYALRRPNGGSDGGSMK